jgi:hypothetical protein
MKHLEENSELHNIRFGNDFLVKSSGSKTKRSIELHQNVIFCVSKDNINRTKMST